MKQIRPWRIKLFAAENFWSPKLKVVVEKFCLDARARENFHEFECNKTLHLHKLMRIERIRFIFEALDSVYQAVLYTKLSESDTKYMVSECYCKLSWFLDQGAALLFDQA